MSKTKKTYSAEFKSKVSIELIRGEQTLNELAAKYQIAPATLSAWHKQFQERASDIFRKGKSAEAQENAELKAQLATSQRKIGQLTLERDWLEKNLTKSLERTARTALVSRDHPNLTVKRQSELLSVNRTSAYLSQRKEVRGQGEQETLT